MTSEVHDVSHKARWIKQRIEREEEQWKKDHRAAMEVYDVEERIANALWLYGEIVRLDERWRLDVLRDPGHYSDELHQGISGLFGQWAGVAQGIIDSAVENLEVESA